MTPLLSYIARIVACVLFGLALGLPMWTGYQSNADNKAYEVNLGEAYYQEAVAIQRTRTVERDLELCEAEYPGVIVNALREAHRGLEGR
jgi:hypothetical protein